eukprot:CAMPEP_0172798388 /NCGR_PEP_ID=MMETSP1075-20121228/1126_1 /TAXON_ID=2916 /ORGANISM="Ceratium fusus, Strain PA161109" /LENGTH=150 /DNA_ID=CAMNT_0013635845 /DNA_START=300 /DNA_END=753 /DNA_ORIENTATION=-
MAATSSGRDLANNSSLQPSGMCAQREVLRNNMKNAIGPADFAQRHDLVLLLQFHSKRARLSIIQLWVLRDNDEVNHKAKEELATDFCKSHPFPVIFEFVAIFISTEAICSIFLVLLSQAVPSHQGIVTEGFVTFSRKAGNLLLSQAVPSH